MATGRGSTMLFRRSRWWHFRCSRRRRLLRRGRRSVGLGSVEAHGFASQGFSSARATTSGQVEKRELEFSESDQLHEPAHDRLRSAFSSSPQARPSGDYGATMDWFYMDYRFADGSASGGRTKLPSALHEVKTSILPGSHPSPQSVYPVTNRDTCSRRRRRALRSARLTLGRRPRLPRLRCTIIFTVATQPGSPFTVQELRVPYLAGGD